MSTPSLLPEEIQALNAAWCNGVAPGYYPTCPSGTGLILSLGGGTSVIGGNVVPYVPGSLVMTDNTQNYVYVDQVTGVPNFRTSGFTAGDLTIAVVTTASGNIVDIRDVRTWFNTAQVPSLPTIPCDVGCTWMGFMPSSGAIIHLPFAGTVGGGSVQTTFPLGLVGSEAHLLAPCTSGIIFNIYKNGTLIGTMNFTAGATRATFTMNNQQVFNGGGGTPDVLILLSPVTVDPTASDLGIVLRGSQPNTGA